MQRWWWKEVRERLYPKKVMISFWWDMEGIHESDREFLHLNQTISTVISWIDWNWLLRKNALHISIRPHVVKPTLPRLKDFGWEIILHPSYSPDLAHSNYHLFCGFHNSLNIRNMNSDDEVKIWFQNMVL